MSRLFAAFAACLFLFAPVVVQAQPQTAAPAPAFVSDRIIVETDGPYLAPIPHRGRRNEPAYIGHVLDKLAEIRGWSAEEADRITTEAFFGLFDRIPRPA